MSDHKRFTEFGPIPETREEDDARVAAMYPKQKPRRWQPILLIAVAVVLVVVWLWD